MNHGRELGLCGKEEKVKDDLQILQGVYLAGHRWRRIKTTKGSKKSLPWATGSLHRSLVMSLEPFIHSGRGPGGEKQGPANCC